jgi:hypothetical protein
VGSNLFIPNMFPYLFVSYWFFVSIFVSFGGRGQSQNYSNKKKR